VIAGAANPSAIEAPNLPGARSSRASRRIRTAGSSADSPVHQRDALAMGMTIAGPALIVEAHTTTFVDHGWTAAVVDSGALVLTDSGIRPEQETPAAVRDEISTGRLLAIARDMGEMLQRTAISTNVKERLDFSCA